MFAFFFNVLHACKFYYLKKTAFLEQHFIILLFQQHLTAFAFSIMFYVSKMLCYTKKNYI